MLRARGFGATNITPTLNGSGNISGSNSSTKTSQFWDSVATTIQAGTLVFAAAVWIGASTTISSVSDTKGNTWNVVQSGVNNGTACGCGIAWSLITRPFDTNTSGSNQITFNLSASVTTFNWQGYYWLTNGLIAPTVTAGNTATGNSTAPAVASSNTPNVGISRTGSVAVAAWDATRAGTAGGSYTERYDGTTGTGRFYGMTRQNLAPNTSTTPSATIATSAANWAMCEASFVHSLQTNMNIGRDQGNVIVAQTAARF